MLRVLHFWQNYIPGQNVDIHNIFLKLQDVKSYLLAEKINFNGNTYGKWNFQSVDFFCKTGSNTIRDRVNCLLNEKVFQGFYHKRLEFFLEKNIDRVRPDILHAHFGPSGCKLIKSKIKFNLPLLVSFYGIDVSSFLRNPKIVESYKVLFDYANCCQVMCDEAKKRLINIGCPEKKINIFNAMLNVEDYQYSPRVLGESVSFIIAARFIEKKGYPYLLKAFADLRRKGRDIYLTIIGYGPLKEVIVKDVNDLKISDRVKIIDTSKIDRFEIVFGNELKNNDVFVMPSVTARNGDDEGGPAMSLVYAQSSGLPVISTHFPGSERSVFEGETGIYCKERSVESLAEKMDFMIHNPNVWNVMGKNGSAYVQKNFSIKNQIAKTIDLYKLLINNG